MPDSTEIQRAKAIAAIRSQIDSIIDRRATDWQTLQNRLLHRFREYERNHRLLDAIYRIYTREDRQTGLNYKFKHMKEPQKIAEEIFLHRFGEVKTRGVSTKQVEKRSDFSIYDVSDIIGITIVCPFDHDVTRILEQINEDAARNRFTIAKMKSHS